MVRTVSLIILSNIQSIFLEVTRKRTDSSDVLSKICWTSLSVPEKKKCIILIRTFLNRQLETYILDRRTPYLRLFSLPVTKTISITILGLERAFNRRDGRWIDFRFTELTEQQEALNTFQSLDVLWNPVVYIILPVYEYRRRAWLMTTMAKLQGDPWGRQFQLSLSLSSCRNLAWPFCFVIVESAALTIGVHSQYSLLIYIYLYMCNFGLALVHLWLVQVPHVICNGFECE